MPYRAYADLFTPGFAPNGPQLAEVPEARHPLLQSRDLLFLGAYAPYSSVIARRTEMQEAGRREFAIATHAYRNAPLAAGTFPVVVYAPGANGPSFENDVLCEYLASHGYLVVATASRGSVGRITIDAEGLEAQARDVEFLVGIARGFPGADSRAAAVIGHSWGGLASVVAASRTSTIQAVVTLDGTIRYFGERPFVQAALAGGGPYTTPSLFLNQGANTDAKYFAGAGADTGFAFFDALHYADATRITFRSMDHQNFVALYNRFAGRQRWNFVSDTALTNRGYEQMATYVLQFLAATLRRDSTALRNLTAHPPIRGVASGDVHVMTKTADRPLPTAQSFWAAAKKSGISEAMPLLERIRRRNSTYMIPEDELSSLDWDLPGREAVALFQVRAAMYPASIMAHTELGEAYMAQLDSTSARASFQRAVQIDSTTTYARDMLLKLGRR